jgi:hypothetical protein
LLDCKRPRKPTLRFDETGSTHDVRLTSYNKRLTVVVAYTYVKNRFLPSKALAVV